MCGLYGFSDTQNQLTRRQKTKLAHTLAAASEERGADASGVAYNSAGKLHIYKRAVRGRRLRHALPQDAWVVMGHTRLTTQGNEKQNRNNHPFSGRNGAKEFALAHNGVLQNDVILRKNLQLPSTKIQTDSYIAVQMLEASPKVSVEEIRAMAEQLIGTFTISVLDSDNTLTLVKGNNPLCLVLFKDIGLYLYASTPVILQRAIQLAGFLKGVADQIEVQEGEIVCIKKDGTLRKSAFSTHNLQQDEWLPFCFGEELDRKAQKSGFLSYLEDVLTAATSMGFGKEEILFLLEYGYSLEEIVNWMDEPETLESFLHDAYVGIELYG